MTKPTITLTLGDPHGLDESRPMAVLHILNPNDESIETEHILEIGEKFELTTNPEVVRERLAIMDQWVTAYNRLSGANGFVIEHAPVWTQVYDEIKQFAKANKP